MDAGYTVRLDPTRCTRAKALAQKAATGLTCSTSAPAPAGSESVVDQIYLSYKSSCQAMCQSNVTSASQNGNHSLSFRRPSRAAEHPVHQRSEPDLSNTNRSSSNITAVIILNYTK